MCYWESDFEAKEKEKETGSHAKDYLNLDAEALYPIKTESECHVSKAFTIVTTKFSKSNKKILYL